MTKIIKAFVKYKGVEIDKESMDREIRNMNIFKKKFNEVNIIITFS